ncbi:MAG: hypothetical protein D6690_14300 [Nitrospirae bacterium]|nr:MAG: hypothetical protein D6690_14300 [Nitrospirota bacterium]
MSKMTIPVKQWMRRPEVGNLQDALKVLLERCILLVNDERVRPRLPDALQREMVEQTYGRASRKKG